MASSSSSIAFCALPREIRDLIYEHIAPRNKTYIIPCTKKKSLPRFISDASPDLAILWTSKPIQHEFLQRLCATGTFRFIFPRGPGSLYSARQPISQPHANLLQRIEIHMDLQDHAFCALRMLSRDGIRRRSCRIVLRNELMLSFPLIAGVFFAVLAYLEGFETVVVVQKFAWGAADAREDERFCWYMGFELGPSRVYREGGAACHEFHPRKFIAQRVAEAQ